MPIRFQVDPDFYDHPKTTGMSDAAFSLWVRAGSFSAAKLSDGFVSEDVLVHTLRSSVEVADELVGRGLWRRRKGGFQFHQWGVRNLTRERVETDRATDRNRKRESRNSAKSHVEREIVRPDSDRTPDGIPGESEQNPAVSVSVSSSVSESVSGSGQARPPVRCPRHANHPDPPPCRACADARQAAERWDTEDTTRSELIALDIETARRDPRMRCQHGADGGRFIHPRTGKSATCAHCRRTTTREAS
jgi:hypothetical protein